jgi:hypothetical protein
MPARHVLISVYCHCWMHEAYSSPLLLLAAVFLLAGPLLQYGNPSACPRPASALLFCYILLSSSVKR